MTSRAKCRWSFWLSIVVALVLQLTSISALNAQIYLQLEQANSLEVRKYSPGEKITFRMKQFGDNWISDPILRILPEDDAIVFYDQIVHLDEITHFSYQRPWAKATGLSLMGFGSSWLLFGGAIEGLRSIDAIDTQYEFGTDTAIIGLSTLAVGYLTQKLWSKAVKKMNRRNRLKIIDVRF